MQALISRFASYFFGFSIPQNPYMPNLVLSARSEGPFHISATLYFKVPGMFSTSAFCNKYFVRVFVNTCLGSMNFDMAYRISNC